MTKNKKFKSGLNNLLFVEGLFILFCCTFVQAQSLRPKAVIETIQNAFKSITRIEVKNTIFRKVPGQGLRVAKFSREGAGAVIASEGLVVTNSHIVRGVKNNLSVVLGGRKYKAKVVYLAPENDLAFIKIKSKTSSAVIKLANPVNIFLGDAVYAVGSSKFLKGTIIQGKVTGMGKKRKTESDKIADIIKVNLQMEKGDSGGPLLNKEGKLLGLLVTRQKKPPHHSFAISSKVIQKHYSIYLQNKR